MTNNILNSKLIQLLTLSLVLSSFPLLANADCAIGATTPDCVSLDGSLTNPDLTALFDLQVSGYLVISTIFGVAFGVVLGRR